MVGGYYAEGATDFYTTAERRGTAMKKGIFFYQTQTVSEANTLLRGAFINQKKEKNQDKKLCENVMQ